MSTIQIVTVFLVTYWAILQVWRAQYVDRRTVPPYGPFTYMRIAVTNLLSSILFWSLLHTGKELPLIITIALLLGLADGLMSVIFLPAIPASQKRKPMEISMTTFATTTVLYTVIAFAAVYTAFFV